MNIGRNERKIAAMHRLFGVTETAQCKGCDHLLTFDYHGSRFRKCKLYGLSRSEATDWRLAYTACGMYCKPVENWIPVIRRLYPQQQAQRPAKGQITLDMLEGLPWNDSSKP